MKLTEEEIDKILDDATEYIYDDLWNEFSTEWVEDYLSDNEINEYDNEDINSILEGLKENQKQMQEEAKSEEKLDLYQAVDEFIADYNDIHLDSTDIGIVLVKLADAYLVNE